MRSDGPVCEAAGALSRGQLNQPSLLCWIDAVAPQLAPRLRRTALMSESLFPGVCQVVLPTDVADALLAHAEFKSILSDMSAAAPRRLRAFVAGRLCGELALERAGAGRSAVGRGCAGEPVWPAGWVGSISHTDHQAIAIVACHTHSKALGVDIEILASADAATAIIDVCLTARERERLSASSLERRSVATLWFSAKEAYYKAVYPDVRRFIDFDEVEVLLSDSAGGELRILPVDRSDGLPVLACRFAARGSAWVTYVRVPATPLKWK